MPNGLKVWLGLGREFAQSGVERHVKPAAMAVWRRGVGALRHLLIIVIVVIGVVFRFGSQRSTNMPGQKTVAQSSRRPVPTKK